ncbi:apolipoprotein N-acyltransferase [Chitinophaga oryziterrae]|uniref:Apolipoprotein N-acyltransferase n=1 Tax=Chitinophaga oryziterrae TaxID=1031224 RepID=A0A6N8J3N7_9BACT|nr:apolipoprotein N-acyltransferase [Chitinophaga oryziterrae]MVT39308.1 apolipoprotein N-acyltransferase [Chitinophaga oryziterrae]
MAKRSAQRWVPVLLSLIGGALLWAAWPTSPLTFLIFIAFIPLLRLADTVESTGKYYGCIYLSLFIWNAGSTWWVGNTTVPVSGLAANLINTTVMSVPLLGYYRIRKRLGTTASYFALIVYWITFEYVHLNWEFSWPWLSLGNAFAMHPSWIQWYEYTGVSGGTLWVLLCNISIYHAWLLRKRYPVPISTFIWKTGWIPAAIIILPLLLSSLVQYTFKTPEGPSTPVVIVQPNIDPYDKFAENNASMQLDKLLQLSKQKTDSQTAYIIWPETALFTNGAWENNLATEGSTQSIHYFLQQYPKATLISGAITLKHYGKPDEIPYTARSMDDNSSYDVFNSAVQIDTSGTVQVYHKYKLVPGVEMVPYARYMFFMKYLALDMGGITGSYGRTPDENILTSTNKHIKVSAAICYESVYGEYVAEHVRMGANLLFIITNDGWWGNTEGHRQHLQYARLRAIETRRWVARSANTGVSCIIDPMGRIQQPLPYWKEGVIKGNVTPGYILTFYVKYGDLISKAASAFCILLIIYSYYLRFRQKKIS